MTGLIPGLRCSALEHPLPGSSLNDGVTWQKLARLIESLPFE
jgi:hypothetical protein